MIDQEHLRPEEPNRLQLLIDSFLISSGSPIAHALFERAYAIEHHTSFDDVAQFFLDMYTNLSTEEKKKLNLEMAKLHHQNPQAKAVIKREIDETKSDLNTVMSDQLPRDFDMADLEKKVKKRGLTIEQLDQALKKAYSLSPIPERLENLRAIAGFLGLYENQNWWQAIREESKAKIQLKGQSFFS